MLRSEILEGLSIKDRISMPCDSDLGIAFIGEDCRIPITSSVLSKHLLYTGTIGTGKTTAMFQLLHQLIEKMTDDAKKCNKIIVDGNDVNFEGQEFWKSFDVNGDNFKVGNIHSYIGNDVVSVAGNKAHMGNIELAGTSSTLNVSGNDAKLDDVYGSGASSVNISGNNVIGRDFRD